METNPYQSPQTVVADMAVTGETELAGRGMRLLAAIIDGLILTAIYVPIMFGTGYVTRSQQGAAPLTEMVMMGALAFVIFVLVQAWPLAKTAQTWGKKLLGLRITHLDGTQPTLGTIIVKRYLPVQVVGVVPVVGFIASIVNVLFIFRDDRRCVHDLIAGTQVVKA